MSCDRASCSPARGPGAIRSREQFGTDLKALIPVARRADGAAAGARAARERERRRGHRARRQAPERIAAVLARRRADLTFGASGGTIAETMLELCDDPATAMAAAGHDRRPCAARRGDDRRILQRRRGRRHRDRRGRARERCCARFPQTQRTWLKFRGGAYTGANLFALGSPEVAPAIELWRVGRAGPQEGLAAAVGCSGRRCCSARCCGCSRLDEVLARARPQARPRRSRRCELTQPARRRRRRQARRPCAGRSDHRRAAHERPRHLRHGPDGHAARDLHAVPAPLRAAPGAVAAAVPAARVAVDARLCRCG